MLIAHPWGPKNIRFCIQRLPISSLVFAIHVTFLRHLKKIVKTYVDSLTVPESKSKICLGNKFHQDCEFRSSNQTLWGRITLQDTGHCVLLGSLSGKQFGSSRWQSSYTRRPFPPSSLLFCIVSQSFDGGSIVLPPKRCERVNWANDEEAAASWRSLNNSLNCVSSSSTEVYIIIGKLSVSFLWLMAGEQMQHKRWYSQLTLCSTSNQKSGRTKHLGIFGLKSGWRLPAMPLSGCYSRVLYKSYGSWLTVALNVGC